MDHNLQKSNYNWSKPYLSLQGEENVKYEQLDIIYL